MKKSKDYCAVIVTFHPDIQHLESMARQILSAGVNLIIFDNTPASDATGLIGKIFEFDSQASVSVVGEGINYGLGIAFNKSIDLALKTNKSMSAFLFFDQDSTVSKNDLLDLIDGYEKLTALGIPVGVLGATPVDVNNKPYRVKREQTELANLPEGYHCVSFVISSFSLVPKMSIDTVGPFDERLFIDLVDSEYSYRCKRNYLYNIVSDSVRFTHVIGINRLNFLGRRFSVSSPLRNYYQARNLILVGIAYKWRLILLFKILKRFVQVVLSGMYFGYLSLRIKYFIEGLCDGLRGRGGAYNSSDK